MLRSISVWTAHHMISLVIRSECQHQTVAPVTFPTPRSMALSNQSTSGCTQNNPDSNAEARQTSAGQQTATSLILFSLSRARS